MCISVVTGCAVRPLSPRAQCAQLADLGIRASGSGHLRWFRVQARRRHPVKAVQSLLSPAFFMPWAAPCQPARESSTSEEPLEASQASLASATRHLHRECETWAPIVDWWVQREPNHTCTQTTQWHRSQSVPSTVQYAVSHLRLAVEAMCPDARVRWFHRGPRPPIPPSCADWAEQLLIGTNNCLWPLG